MSIDLDALLDRACAEGELMAGMPQAFVVSRYPDAAISADIEVRDANPLVRWTEDEDRFVRENLGRFSDAEIAAVLGRSEQAVKIRRQRHLHLPGLSRHPDFLTANQMADILGTDGHTTIKLLDRGIIDGWVVTDREMRVTRLVTLYRWAVNPMHWIYFWRSVQEPERIADPHLRRLIIRQKARWNDDWWTPSQVAEYHGVHHTNVNNYIQAGKIRSVKWGNNWILKSEAMKPGLFFFKGSGAVQADWSEEGDLFLLRAREDLGLMYKEIAKLMKQPQKRVDNRYRVLKRRGLDKILRAKFGVGNFPGNEEMDGEQAEVTAEDVRAKESVQK
jgi:hypothetical protein